MVDGEERDGMNQVSIGTMPPARPALSAGATTGSQVFHTCCWLYLIAFFILPDECGFRLGFLWSAKRIMMFVCYAMILFNRRRLTDFWTDVQGCTGPNVLMGLYLFVRGYTMLYRMSIYCVTGFLLDEILVFYLFVYLLRHEVSVEQLLRFLRLCLVILALEGIWEAATGINLFGLLRFAGEVTTASMTRGENARVVGNCHHAIQYGMYLALLFVLSCVDPVKKRLYLFYRPGLFVLAMAAVFLSGSRAPFGVFLLTVALICLFSNRDERRKSLLILAAIVAAFTLLIMAVFRTSFGRQVMTMLCTVVDGVLGTEYAHLYTTASFTGSTEYREALAKVFELPYLNKLVGRGASYAISIVIDGYWLRSVDNSYVMAYIQFAYPGLFLLIGQGIYMAGSALRGLWRYRNGLFAAVALVVVNYFLNIWYVAMMGTFMYIWMLLALLTVVRQQEDNRGKREETNA